jgi:hypothetical protein
VRFYDTQISVPLRSYTANEIEVVLKELHFETTARNNIGIPVSFLTPALLFVAEKQ